MEQQPFESQLVMHREIWGQWQGKCRALPPTTAFLKSDLILVAPTCPERSEWACPEKWVTSLVGSDRYSVGARRAVPAALE